MSQNVADPLLRVESLALGYGDIQATWDVSLLAWPGQVTVVLGRNGAGKTTTLLGIAGLLKARSGAVVFHGEDITSRPPYGRTKLGVSLVQENKRIFRRQTVEQNLLLGAYTVPHAKRRHSVEEAYQRFPVLGARRRSQAGSLSGGQQQMLAIAQALMAEPTLLLLDEPSAGLAPVVVAEVMAQVLQLKSEGICIVLVEQLVDQATRVADHLVVLDQGRVALTSDAGDINDFEAVRDVYLGRRSSKALPPTRKAESTP